MKPKDLKTSFKWEDRKPYIQDQILYVPEHYQEHDLFVMPSLKEVFGNDNPVCIEYCSGHGHWIIEKALANPKINWIAVEKMFERVRKIHSKRVNRGVCNLLVVCGEAQPFTKHYLQPEAIQEVYINFPDPWPKRRHAKHRLMQQEFIEDFTKAMKKMGSFTFVTDDENYLLETLELMKQQKQWAFLHETPYLETDTDTYGYSFFESLWNSLGRTIRHISLKKI